MNVSSATRLNLFSAFAVKSARVARQRLQRDLQHTSSRCMTSEAHSAQIARQRLQRDLQHTSSRRVVASRTDERHGTLLQSLLTQDSYC